MTQPAPKPWEAIGMSRASWYRHGKPQEKPERETKWAWAARPLGLSERTIRRWRQESLKDARRRMPRRKDDPAWQEKTDAQYDTAYDALWHRIKQREAKFLRCHHHGCWMVQIDGKVRAGPFETEEEARAWMVSNEIL